jgi:predicted GNAT family acetyltransferase
MLSSSSYIDTTVQELGRGKVDVSVGSALDIFGGNFKYSDLLTWFARPGDQAQHTVTSSSPVVHDAASQMFSMMSTAGEKAYLTYEVLPHKCIDLNHTFVPESFRGKGAGAQLATVAFEWIKQNNYRVPSYGGSCSYISATFLPKHPEYQALMTPTTS